MYLRIFIWIFAWSRAYVHASTFMCSTHRITHILHARHVPAYRHAKPRSRDHVHAYTFVRKRHGACASARLPCMLALARSRARGLRPSTGACVEQNGNKRSRHTGCGVCGAPHTQPAPMRTHRGGVETALRPSAPAALSVIALARFSSAALY